MNSKIIKSKSLSNVFEMNESESDEKLGNIITLAPTLNTKQELRNIEYINKVQKVSRNKNIKPAMKIQNYHTSIIGKSTSSDNKLVEPYKISVFSIIPEYKLLTPIEDEVLFQGELLKYTPPNEAYNNSKKNYQIDIRSFITKFCLVTYEKLSYV